MSAAYPPRLNAAIVRLIREAIQAAVITYSPGLHIGSADPHSADGAHSAEDSRDWAPSGSLRQLEPELDSVLLDEPLPKCNVVVRSSQEDPPKQSKPPGPFTTEELIVKGRVEETLQFKDKCVDLLRRARRGKDGWRIARDLRPQSITWTEAE